MMPRWPARKRDQIADAVVASSARAMTSVLIIGAFRCVPIVVLRRALQAGRRATSQLSPPPPCVAAGSCTPCCSA
jgi:hypothetical protein